MPRMKRWIAAPLGALLLAGCGGGIYLDLYDDDPPAVSLAAGAASAAPGAAVALSAGASDDDYVYAVEFFRVDPGGNTIYLGSDGGAPFQWNAVMPNVAAGQIVQFFARATDSAGQQTDSARVSVTAVAP
jgi:hypothetical protein